MVYQYSPTRWYVFKIYFKRIIRWRRNSWPYLTIDSFADFCDVNVSPPKFRGKPPSLSKITKAKSIFCNSDELQGFLDTHHKIINARIIVSGNTDFEFHKKLENVPKSVRRIYLQNSYINDDPKYRTIPIGVENYRYGLNGNPKHLRNDIHFASRKDAVLFGPFSPTHPERKSAFEFVRETKFIEMQRSRIEPEVLARRFQQFKFIAAVRGNGIDTHRTWEALYRGCIPIVKIDPWSDFLKILALPVEFVEDWTTKSLETCIQNSLINEFEPREIKQLWMPYWEDLMTRDITI